MGSRIALLLVTCALAWQAGSPVTAQPRVTVIRGGTLIDGTGGPPIADATLVIENNRIRSVAAGRSAAIPPGALEIDARGKFIVPGLWDTHTHFRGWVTELLVSHGITSVLAYGSGSWAWLNAIRDGVASRKIHGPRFFTSQGPLGGAYMIEDEAMVRSALFESREDAIDKVRQKVDAHADIIKVYTGTTAEQLEIVADRAHASGLKVSGHIGIGAREAAQAGVDNLAHATGLPVPDLLTPADLARVAKMRVFDTGRLRVTFPAVGASWDHDRQRWGPNPDLTEYPLWIEDPRRIMAFGLMDRRLAEDLIALLVKEDVFIESCLGYVFRYVHDHVDQWRDEDRRLLSDPNLSYIPARYVTNILDYSLMEQFEPDELELMKKGYRNFQWFTKAFVAAGGKVTTGMDTISNYHATMVPGLAVAREMELLVDAGISPMQAIQAATSWPAELLGQSKVLGTLEPGKLADLLVLRRNPLADIRAIREIDVVMQDGEVLRTGYHFDFALPIPEPIERDVSYGDWIVSEIPTRIESVSPAAVVEGSDTITLTIRGREFVSSSVVQFDGRHLLQTRFVSPRELQATVPAALLRNVGTYRVRIIHRAPGWGTTNAGFLIVKFK